MALDSRIVLLIGADVSIVDESSFARTLTAVGNAARTTSQSKFGGASITFDGTGDYVSSPNVSNIQFPTGDFTVEGFFRFVTKTDSQAMVGHWGTVNSNSSWFLWITGGKLTFRGITGATVRDVAATWVPTLGQWYHIAADRSGSTLRVYVDGTVIATDSAFSITLNIPLDLLTIGAIGTANGFPTYDFNGQIDELRITKGLAQYNGAFTPPTIAFPRADTEGRVSQLPLEVMTLSSTPIDLRLSQLPLELVVSPIVIIENTQFFIIA